MLNKLIVKFLFSVLVLFNSYLFSQDWVVELNKKYSPATTVIVVENNDGNIIFGTGFNVQEDGLVVTNYHVVEEAKKIKVKFKDGDIFDVQYYTFIDRDKDFAILKIPGFKLPIVELGDSDAIEIGQEVVAIGNPKGAWHSVTKGIISQIVSR